MEMVEQVDFFNKNVFRDIYKQLHHSRVAVISIGNFVVEKKLKLTGVVCWDSSYCFGSSVLLVPPVGGYI